MSDKSDFWKNIKSMGMDVDTLKKETIESTSNIKELYGLIENSPSSPGAAKVLEVLGAWIKHREELLDSNDPQDKS